jgi:glycosyltransferase involved in cell wall biosynthesis
MKNFNNFESNSPIYSICIPTFNRASVLKNTLSSIVEFRSNDFEVIISDNASIDSTMNVVSEFNDSRLKYFTNSENMGVVYNILKSIERASGKYVVLLSDEDKVDMSYISEILSNQFSFGAYIISETYNYFDAPTKDTYKLLKNHGFKYGYLSGHVFLREAISMKTLWNEYGKKNFGYMGYYPHIFILNEIIREGYEIQFCSDFVFRGEISRNYISNIDDNVFFHPSERYKKFLNDSLYINNLSELTRFQKSKLIYYQYFQYLRQVLLFEYIIKDNSVKNYYQIKNINYNPIEYVHIIVNGLSSFNINGIILSFMILFGYLLILTLGVLRFLKVDTIIFLGTYRKVNRFIRNWRS